MSRTSRVLTLLASALVLMLLAGCGTIIPSDLFSTTTVPKPSAEASSAPEQPQPQLIRTRFAPSPKPMSADPVLKHGNFGFHDSVDLNDTEGESSALNSGVRLGNLLDLVKKQRRKLLCTFRSSPEVRRLIRDAGGDLDDVTYSTPIIDAHPDTAVSTPWVTATLRASFPTEGGERIVDVSVYRQKTPQGLDNTPYVNGVSVGYVQSDGSISNPSSPAFPR